MTEEKNITPSRDTKADLTADIVIQQDGKNIWEAYFAAWAVKAGYFKGVDVNGQTIIVQTLAAKLIQEGREPSDNNRLPELYAYLETIEEGEKVWTEILVAWKGKKDGFFTGKTTDGNNVVMQTKEAKTALNGKRKPKQVKALDLDDDV